ncbi:MAG: hypothetical protein LQ340_007877, partial [Diploschistes diacapsis]
FVADTGDGGLSVWLPQLRAWEGFPGGEPYRGPTGSPLASSPSPDDRLDCTCRCAGVQFYITRPNEDSRRPCSPYSDAIVPHTEGGDRRENRRDEKWWISDDGMRFAAALCACNSCRKSSGYDVQQWAFVPKVNIFQKDGRPTDFSMGTLRQYTSREGIARHFCGICGATVFWRSTERPDLIDVSVGLMEAPSGSRAEEWLDWKLERISFVEFAQHKRLMELLEKGLGDARARKAKETE